MGNASSVPNDVLAWAASFAHEDRHICTPKDLPPYYLRQVMLSRDDQRHESLVKKQFLSLRAVSRRGRDLVQLAVETRFIGEEARGGGQVGASQGARRGARSGPLRGGIAQSHPLR